MTGKCVLAAMAVASVMLILPGLAQEKVDFGPILGKWDLEVDADGQYFYLTMELKEVSGKLEGTISESQGTFTDLALQSLAFDGTTLSFDFTSPTPPDGMDRLVRADLKLAEGRLDGSLNIPALGISVRAAATKQKA